MESFVQRSSGTHPRRVHADLNGLKDDELCRNAFAGRQVQFYRRHDPTAFSTRGQLRELHVPTNGLEPSDLHDPQGSPMALFSNPDCLISISRRTEAADFYERNIDGDLVYFVHEGIGTFVTEFGEIDYRPGDYIYLPKASTYRNVPSSPTHLLVVETFEEIRVPQSPILGRHWPFDSSMVFIPEAKVQTEGPHEIRLNHRLGTTQIAYAHDPCDVEAWRGDNFPFRLNIADYDCLMSDTQHLPPSVSAVLANDNVVILNFLPRPAESAPGTERTPWYHRNADFDEIAFYHGGTSFGVQLTPGLISHAPQGIHHGAPERARERARRTHNEYDRLDWKIIAVDTRHRLQPSETAAAFFAPEQD